MINTLSPDSAVACLSKKKVFNANCESCSLRPRMLFSDLDVEGFSQRMAPISHTLSTTRTAVYHQGQPPKNIYSLRRGFIKLIQLNEKGEQRIIRILGPGSCLGLEALQGQSYRQTAEAVTEVDYCTIPIDTVSQIEQEQPRLFVALQQELQKQLEDTEYWLNQLVAGPIKQRLCRFLLLQHQIQQPHTNEITLISNQDIASILATSEETVSRCLSDLRNKNNVEKLERRVYRLNLDAVAAVADI